VCSCYTDWCPSKLCSCSPPLYFSPKSEIRCKGICGRDKPYSTPTCFTCGPLNAGARQDTCQSTLLLSVPSFFLPPCTRRRANGSLSGSWVCWIPVTSSFLCCCSLEFPLLYCLPLDDCHCSVQSPSWSVTSSYVLSPLWFVSVERKVFMVPSPSSLVPFSLPMMFEACCGDSPPLLRYTPVLRHYYISFD